MGTDEAGIGSAAEKICLKHADAKVYYKTERCPVCSSSEVLQAKYGEDMDTKIERFQVTLPEGSVSQQIDKVLQPITNLMNQTTLRVNKVTWEQNLIKQQTEVDRLTDICRTTSGNWKFRPNSSADCIKALEEVGIVLTRTTDKGNIQCDKEVLESVQGRHPLVGQIMDARNAISVLSQLKKWEEFANRGSVQCTWDQNGTPMGRYTSAEPNLQNRVVPIRETIEAQEGTTFLSFDLGQAEYVTWAALSRDQAMGEAIRSGKDIHQAMGEAILEANPGLDLHGETSRSLGKTVNFAILYRMKVGTLAQKLGVSGEVAQKIMDTWFAKARVAKQYEDEFLDIARDRGFTQTKFGRRREMPILRIAARGELSEAEKTCWHHHVAGSAAELLKYKTLKTLKALGQAGFDHSQVKVAINLHDEVILMVRDDVLDQVRLVARKAFEEAGIKWEWYLPYSVTELVGKTWKSVSK